LLQNIFHMECLGSSIKYWAEDDRPREKLILKGRAVLSDAELMAILIGSGTKGQSALDIAKALLAKAGHDLHKLGILNLDEICQTKGLGPARAVTLIAALELGRRRKLRETKTLIKIRSSKDAFLEVQPMLIDLDYEEFWIILLSQSNHVLHKTCVSKGGMTATIADVRVIFREAISKRATGIIAAHNHPGGTLKPSRPDHILTKKLKETGVVLDIPLVDHLIVSNEGYVSFADEGWL
jgi:DNA repair protein RadC